MASAIACTDHLPIFPSVSSEPRTCSLIDKACLMMGAWWEKPIGSPTPTSMEKHTARKRVGYSYLRIFVRVGHFQNPFSLGVTNQGMHESPSLLSILFVGVIT